MEKTSIAVFTWQFDDGNITTDYPNDPPSVTIRCTDESCPYHEDYTVRIFKNIGYLGRASTKSPLNR